MRALVFSKSRPHQGARETARRRVQLLRLRYKTCRQEMRCAPSDRAIDLADVAQGLHDEILALLPAAYGRSAPNAPRRRWLIRPWTFGIGFREYESRRRLPLVRLRFHTDFGCPVELKP